MKKQKEVQIKIYITKPIHTRYGRIQLDNPFKDINDMINNSCIWFYRPSFEKPFIDIFEENFCLRGWDTFSKSLVLFKDFPDGEVKNHIYKKIFESVDSNFYEKIKNRYYNWLEIIDVELIQRKNKGNFDLYLMKPKYAWDIQFAGIDRAKIFLYQPDLKTEKKYHELCYIEGKFFRKTKEVENLCIEMWKTIKNSFDVEDNEHFLNLITDSNHKINQSSKEFIKIFHCDLKLKQL